MEDCIFCKIVVGQVPSKKLFETDKTQALLDAFPAAKGHSLVIPKKHYETLLDIPEEDLKDAIVVAKKDAQAVVKATNADGFNLVQNNKEAAGQLVKHVHFHIVPRLKDDGLKLHFPSNQAEEKVLLEMQEKIKKEL